MQKAAAIFAILMGLAMTVTWVVLFSLGQYPDAAVHPVETGYLLAAEALTALALILGGTAVLAHRSWGLPVLLLALGELAYCAIRYAGELGEAGSFAGLGFFTGVGLAGLIFALTLVRAAMRAQQLRF